MMDNTSHSKCSYESYKIEQLIDSHQEVLGKMERAANAIEEQTTTIDHLVKQNDKFFKILLAVVCSIALGKELLFQIKDVFLSKASAEIVNEK